MLSGIQNNVAFNGSKNNTILKAAKDASSIGRKINTNLLSDEEHMIEHQRGLLAGYEAINRGVDECRDIIVRETLAGNFDYIKGFNQAIGKDMAKKAYASIAESVK